jgi:hypothetical protein
MARESHRYQEVGIRNAFGTGFGGGCGCVLGIIAGLIAIPVLCLMMCVGIFKSSSSYTPPENPNHDAKPAGLKAPGGHQEPGGP